MPHKPPLWLTVLEVATMLGALAVVLFDVLVWRS